MKKIILTLIIISFVLYTKAQDPRTIICDNITNEFIINTKSYIVDIPKEKMAIKQIRIPAAADIKIFKDISNKILTQQYKMTILKEWRSANFGDFIYNPCEYLFDPTLINKPFPKMIIRLEYMDYNKVNNQPTNLINILVKYEDDNLNTPIL